MSSVKLSEVMITEAKILAKVYNRSLAGQIGYWTKIGKIAEENPDLTYQFIKDILIGQEETKQGHTIPYLFGE